MANRERPRDRGARLAREALAALGKEARLARVNADLTQRAVADAVGVHRSWLCRFELGKTPTATVARVGIVLGVVGLDLSARAYPGSQPIRDSPQLRLAARFEPHLAASIPHASEVPLPLPGDPRAWDMLLHIGRQRWGTEFETRVSDLQARLRSIQLKRRDGGVDGVILVLAATRHHRWLVREHAAVLAEPFPGDPESTLTALKEGRPPTADTLLLI